jgi:DNA-directed RNA polymerase subunit H (RpoH/RPB5)
MDMIRKINQTRYTLKSHLQREWDTSVIQDISEKEVEIMYTVKSSGNPLFSALGQATGCHLSLQHRHLPSHYLHIIYFGFPTKVGDTPTKLTKTCSEKIQKLYDSEAFGADDSFLLILPQPLSDTVSKAMEELNVECQHTLSEQGLQPETLRDIEEYNVYSQRHFRNIHAFHIDILTFDITKHTRVPQQECIRDQKEIDILLKSCNASLRQLPVIKRTDPQAKCMRMAPGDICKITRKTSSGYSISYRVCQ